jgi:esterase
MTNDVANLIKSEKLESVCVAGFSMGGKVGILLAARFPELVSKLAILDICPVDFRKFTPDVCI